MRIVLATVLLVLMAVVVYAAYYWQHQDQYDWQEVENIVKPKINKIIESIKKEQKRLGNKDVTKSKDDDSSASGIRYPVPEETDLSMFDAPGDAEVLEKPLPELESSDQPIKGVVDKLLSSQFFGKMLRVEAVILRFVVTVDNLTKKKMAAKYRVVKPVDGKFLVRADNKTQKYYIDSKNYQRYTEYMGIFENIETEKLVAVYIYYYPLIQEAYDSLGYHNRYFNDRFVQVIDHLLETPGVLDPVELAPTTVAYQYANADLESRSSGQKILIRIGSKNAKKVRAKLTQLRTELTKLNPAKI